MKKNKVLGSVLASSMILGMMVNSGMTIVNAAEASAPQTENVKPAGIEYQTQGDLTLSGTAMDGLELVSKNTVTRGNLNLRYDVKALASINWGDSTEAVIQLPEEFNELAQSKKILDYIESPHFSYNSSTSSKEYDYTKDDMTLVKDTQSNGYLLKLKNPPITGVGIRTTITVTMEMDLGAMVTDTGMRIPDAVDRQAYHFATTLSSVGEIIDWELVGNTNGSDKIPVYQLDPGYELLQHVPTVKEPVLNTSELVTGVAYPGAKVTIKDPTGKEIESADADVSGIYEIKIPRQAVGTVLTVTENTGVGDSQPVTVVVQQDPLQPGKPVIDSGDTILDSALRITGSNATAGNIITVKSEYTGETLRGTVLPNGRWIIPVTPAGWLIAGDRLEITESTPDGQHVSDITYVNVEHDDGSKLAHK